MQEISLKVDSADSEDQGYGRVRLDPKSMEKLGVEVGDIVAITGTRTTVAKVWRLKKEDWGLEKLRIDKYTRLNAEVEVGGNVTVKKVDEEIFADKINLVPSNEIPEHLFKQENFDLLTLTNHAVVMGDVVPIKTKILGTSFLEFKVESIKPENSCIIGIDTEIDVSESSTFASANKITYEDIGGLKKELTLVREMIELPVRHPELFKTLGVEPPKGILLYGPPGTGKTLIAKAVANESGANFYPIAGPEIISKYYGESEQKLREIFEEAEENSPSIIFIDELDSIAPRREDVTGEVERRVVAQLLTMLDGISDRGQVIVIGATNRPDAIDPALRRPGRFDREIEIGVPNEADRLEILKIHTKFMPLKGSAEFNKKKEHTEREIAKYNDKRDLFLADFANLSRGFVGADLACLSREAAIIAMRRQINFEKLGNEEIPEEQLRTLEVTKDDFIRAIREISPSAMREISLETANTKWSDIGGCEDALLEVKESVISPLVDKNKFINLGIRPPKGVLLYGPPGTGKTLIAKAVANESGANFIAVKGPELLSKWVGESERAVREIFKKARQVAPSVIFFDEIDSLAPARGGNIEHVNESVLNQILTEMDGIEELSDVVIMAASNRPDIIDSALLRNGRFDRLIYVPEPTLKDRKQILAVHMRHMPIENSEIPQIYENLSGISEKDIEKIAHRYRGKSVSVKQIIAAARTCPRNSNLGGIELRQSLTEAFDKNNVVVTDVQKTAIINKMAKDTEGFVGSDLEGLVREAAMRALRDNREIVSLSDFVAAKESVHPTMNQHVREYYDTILNKFKGGLPKEAQSYVEYQ